MHELPLNWIPPLLRWYDDNRRELPWRADRDPYHVWISEIMLQQTRIEAVLRYYRRFTEALPDVGSLAAVSDDALLKLWEGLGYYSRARNLKKAARIIMSDCGGDFPRSYEALRKLPGIGDYTAGAIASICYDERVPAVDGNVLRVIARLTGDRSNVLLPQTKREVAAALGAVIPARAGAFNEGLMELGELLCLPNGAPLCESCPIAGFCVARRDGLTDALPVREKALRRSSAEKTVLVIRDASGRLAVEKRPDTGLLSGMYQLPNLDGFVTPEELNGVLCEWGMEPLAIRYIGEAKHVFTHIDWYMKGYSVTVKDSAGRFLFVTDEELKSSYPLPAAFQKMLKPQPPR